MSALPAFAAAWLAITAQAADPQSLPPPGAEDQQVSIMAAFQAAEALQGSLNGLWRLDDADGRTLFIFDITDAGGPPAPLAATPDDPGVEGAWRDPNRPRAPDTSGFLESVRRDGARLSIRFVEGPGGPAQTLMLKAGRDGRWTGALVADGQHRTVVMIHF